MMNEEFDDIYVMMMDALDGELSDVEYVEFESHLRAYPDAMREWESLLAVHNLFQRSPVLAPAAQFAERTLALLPDRQYRVWTMGVLYFVLLFSGLLPILLGLVIYRVAQPLLNNEAVVGAVQEGASSVAQVTGTMAEAVVTGVGQLVVQQPAVLGWFLVMVGVLALWSGVYQQLTKRPLTIGQGAS